jgi:hypothetical protein
MLKKAAVFGLGKGKEGIPLTIDPSPIIPPNPGVNPVPPPGVKPVLNVDGSNPPFPACGVIPVEAELAPNADGPWVIEWLPAGPVNMAGDSGPARKEDDNPDQEKWGPGSSGAGDVSADTGGRAVLLGGGEVFLVPVVVAPPVSFSRLKSSELDPVWWLWMLVELREKLCSNGLGSSSNLDFEIELIGGRIGGRDSTAGKACGGGMSEACDGLPGGCKWLVVSFSKDLRAVGADTRRMSTDGAMIKGDQSIQHRASDASDDDERIEEVGTGQSDEEWSGESEGEGRSSAIFPTLNIIRPSVGQ